MSMILPDIELKTNFSAFPHILSHLERCQEAFIPPLENSVDINKYAKKIIDLAIRFEAWHQNILIGLVAAYFNDEINKHAFITSVSVEKEYNGRGIAKTLLQNCLEFGKKNRFKKIFLKVNTSNLKAIALYKQLGFGPERSTQDEVTMFKPIDGR